MQGRAFAILSAGLIMVGSSSAAWAQATRTWVSGVGDDANPCSRTAPCKTFAGAISKTAAGGEINCLDPAGYGTVTIIKSITIDCEDTQGSILASGASAGIIVNGANVEVVIRGLSINGGSPGSTGVLGIRFIQGASLTIDRVILTNFEQAASVGIRFEPSNANAELYVIDSIVANNSEGIRIQPTGTGSANVSLQNVQVTNNLNSGLLVNAQGNTGTGIRVLVNNSQFSGGLTGINVNVPAGTTGVNMNIANSRIFRNTSDGLLGDGASMAVRVSNTVIGENGNGVRRLNSAVISSFGNNQLAGNGTDGTFSNVIPQQ
jgi:hypothetical protein